MKTIASLARTFIKLARRTASRRLVAQVSNLLYRRLAVGSVSEPLRRSAGWKPAIQQIGNLRYTFRFLSAYGVFGLALATALALGTNLPAQTYSIDWFKIAGGGGASAGGAYAVSGTVGQHDAGGPMTGGSYSLVGGFWVLPVLVQTPGAPTLYITNAAPGFATIWWTPPTPGFTLQSTDSLSPTNWLNAPSGTNNPATVPAALPARFYRLFKP